VNHVLANAGLCTGSGVTYFLSFLLYSTEVEKDFKSIVFMTLTVPEEDSLILNMAVYRVRAV
jgi:hypothetical protein